MAWLKTNQAEILYNRRFLDLKTMERYFSVAITANSSERARHSGLGEIGGCTLFKCDSSEMLKSSKAQVLLPK